MRADLVANEQKMWPRIAYTQTDRQTDNLSFIYTRLNTYYNLQFIDINAIVGVSKIC